MISFFPFPYPVVTPLGEGYAIYVSANPMWENDTWCVQLDDGRILHFSTNQLTGVPNGTYDIAQNRGPAVPAAHGASSSQPGLSRPQPTKPGAEAGLEPEAARNPRETLRKWSLSRVPLREEQANEILTCLESCEWERAATLVRQFAGMPTKP